MDFLGRCLEDFRAGKKLSFEDEVRFIRDCKVLKPKTLFIPEDKWKFLIYTILTGGNIMITGEQGSGKTETAMVLQKIFGFDDLMFTLDMGDAGDDPLTSIVGKTHFDGKTYFAESPFIKAIQVPNAVIRIEEITRAHPNAQNILMRIVDKKQRVLRLNDDNEYRDIFVARGVSFVATANIGLQFTATKKLDRAFSDRFLVNEMDLLTDKEELQLLKMLFPTVNKSSLTTLSKIAHATREDMTSAESQLDNEIISTRMSVQVASLLQYGFNMETAFQTAVYPFFSKEGGAESPRENLKKIVEGLMPIHNIDDIEISDIKIGEMPKKLFEDDDIKNGFAP